PAYSGPGSCSITTGTLNCSFGDLASGASASVHVSATTSYSACSTYPNTATASASNSPSVQDSATIVCQKPLLSVVKSATSTSDPEPADPQNITAKPGDTVTYTVVISNTGTADAPNTTMQDDLTQVLSRSTFVTGSETASSGSVSFTSPNLTWIGTVPADGSVTVTYQVKLATTGWQVGTTVLDNLAVITAPNSNCTTGDEEGCSSGTTVSVTANTDLHITKSVVPDTIHGGVSSAVTYTITVTNTGTAQTFSDVMVADTDFPTVVPFFSPTSVGCSPSVAGCTWANLIGSGIDAGKLDAGQSFTVTIHGTASPNNTTDVGKHVNTATATFTPGPEQQAATISATATLTVLLTPQPSLGITKGVSLSASGPFVPSLTGLLTGTTVYYQIVVTNTGNVALSSVQLSDSKYGLASLGCTIPSSLAVGASFTCAYHVAAPEGTTPNTATASAVFGETQVGPVSASATIQARTPALTIAKSFTGNTLPPLTVGGTTVQQAAEGDTLTYTLGYTLASGPVHNAVITDVLPAGQTYVSGSAAGNDEFTFASFNAGTRTLTWTAATATKSGTVTYRVTIDKGANALAQPLINTATIRSDETAPASATARVFVPAPPQAITQPPTDTLPTRQPGNPGFSLMLLLLALAGFALALGYVTPVPERARRDR
ncbi:MAG TPA: hypothetical protein VEY67_10250, partial [Candidatus Dormibacteraeota bacterium]|nr:hypothetical protein [Candidatus Dormibacteraeota bacterium]